MKGVTALFAVTNMHQCFVRLGDGVTGYLEASPFGGGDNKIAVVATVPAMDSKGARIAHAVFLTERTLKSDCVPDLAHVHPQDPIWEYPLELGEDGKLRRLGA